MGRSNAITAKVPRSRTRASAKSPGTAAMRLREGFGVVVAAAGAYVLVSVVTFHPLDPSFNSNMRGSAEVANMGGIVGAYLADLLTAQLSETP